MHTLIFMDPLSSFKKNVTSQWGEDGILEELFRRIGEGNKTCVEFGAWDGKHMSNTWRLWHDKNWAAVLIEGDQKRHLDLKVATETYPKVTPYHAFVRKSGPDSLDEIFKKLNLQKIDLVSIDIDGDDYYILESLAIKPRVVIIEFNPTIPSFMSIVSKDGEYFGSSAKAITELGEKKGYTLAAITETNCILVRNDEFVKLGVSPVSLEKEFPAKHITYLMSSYDGVAFASQTPPYSKMKRSRRSNPIAFQGKVALVPLSIKVLASKKDGVKKKIGKIPGIKPLYNKLSRAKAVFDWKRNGRPVPAPHMIKEKIVLDYQKSFGAQTLIETGTYMGEMIDATRKYFSKIISIELDPSLAKSAQKKFSGKPNISILEGDSSALLPGIVEKLNGKAIFWLDAHYSGGVTAKGAAYTPILSEVETIARYSQKDTILLVDDARLFVGKDEYPAMSEFKKFIGKKFPQHAFEVKDDVIRVTPR